jgi:tRNA-5-taurinomethyluridine 2-sulfurtransferase
MVTDKIIDMNKNKHVAMLVSGGVDSSVALRLLLDQGYQVTAFYLKIWLEDELAYLGDCPWEEDLAFVRQVCDQAGVPLEVVSLQKEYHEQVVSYTLAEIKAGRTPNPDILCNSRIKFGAFYNKIDAGYDYVATGHYAQKRELNNQAYLYKSPDSIKDQTYFLAHLSQNQLKRALFPIGHLDKPQVRELAQYYNLPNKIRKDSQGICFLGKLKFSDFIRHHVGEQVGALIEHETHKHMGYHKGFWYYTIGQRQGIGLPGGPWYVVAKDPVANTVRISKTYYEPDKVRDNFNIQNMLWIAGQPEATQPLYVKLRHGARKYSCTLHKLADTNYQVKLDERDQGIAPGQFAVFYQDNYCLGAGVISESPA